METAPSFAPARDFVADEALLREVLSDVIRHCDGEGVLDWSERTVALASATRAGDAAAPGELATLIAGLELADVEVLVRALTRWFQLLNLAEDNERVRRLRSHAGDGSRRRARVRSRRSFRTWPRPGSPPVGYRPCSIASRCGRS